MKGRGRGIKQEETQREVKGSEVLQGKARKGKWKGRKRGGNAQRVKKER